MTRGRIAVLGAGAWGTALAAAFARHGAVVLWGRDPAAVATMVRTRQNLGRLPGVALPAALDVTNDLSVALQGADVTVAAVPTQQLRALARSLADGFDTAVPLVLCAKGIERSSGLFPSEVVAEELAGCRIAVLSGPSFAADVGHARPTAVTLASPVLAEAAALGERLGSDTLRLYHSDDVRGVEVGGAAKNVLAIACGVAVGRELGASAVAALTARAFAELARFGRALGGRPETLAGLSGLGDLVLTCGSPQSRNFSYGLALGRGDERPLSEAVVEGVWTAPMLVRLAARHGVSLPVCEAVAAIVDGRLGIDEAVAQLMRRPPRTEG